MNIVVDKRTCQAYVTNRLVTASDVEDSNCFSFVALYYLGNKIERDDTAFIPPVVEKDGMEFPVVGICESAFSNFPKLRKIVIPNTIETIDWNMLNCQSLESIEVDVNNASFCSCNGVLFTKDKKQLVAYPNAKSPDYSIPSGTKIIRSFAFKGCYNLSRLIIPDSVIEIGDNAFYRCVKLDEVIIPDSIKKIGKYSDGSIFKQPRVVYKGKVFSSINDVII